MPSGNSTLPNRSRINFHASQPLQNQLPRIIDMGIIVEGCDNLGEPEFRNRAHVAEAGQTGNSEFYRQSDLLLDFLGIERRGVGIDLHLNRGGIGKSIDGDQPHGAKADTQAHCEQDYDKQSIVERKVDDFVAHAKSFLRQNHLMAK
jgi:hypothetical protein